MNEDKLEIGSLLSDIRHIRGAVEKSNQFLKELMYHPSYRIVIALSAILSISFCLLYGHFIGQYGGYGNIPSNIRLTLFIAAISAGIFITIIKAGAAFLVKQNFPEMTLS